MKNKQKLWISYLALAMIALFLRLWKINYLPSVISHDEVFYTTQAQTLATNGRGTDGEWKVSSLNPETELYAELPGVIMTPAAKIFPNNPILAARFTHAFLGTLIIFVIAALTYELSKSHRLAFFTALIANFNPWLFQFSRMGFDSLFSLFFYLTGMLFLIKNKSWKKLWALPIFYLGFLQYQGLKVVFLPIIILTTFYNIFKEKTSIKELKKNWKKHLPSITVLIASLIIFTSYLFKIQNQTASNRLNFFIFNDYEYLEQTINSRRQLSINSPISDFYPNKMTVIVERFVEQYFNTINLKQLFLELEVVRNPFAVYQHGLFYYIDFLLILIGLIVISKKKNKAVTVLLIGLFLAAPLPSAIVSTGSWMVFRASLLIPLGIIFIGFAFNFLWEKAPKIIFYTFSFVYLVLIARFFYEYFYTYPITGTRDQYFSERVISQYIKRNPGKNIIVSAAEPIFVYQEILVHNNLINEENIDEINQSFQTKNYKIKNISVVGERCIPEKIEANTIYLSHRNNQKCGDLPFSPLNHIQVPSLLDGGVVYRIYNDDQCSSYSLARFPNIKENLFDLDQLKEEEFCRSFFIRN